MALLTFTTTASPLLRLPTSSQSNLAFTSTSTSACSFYKKPGGIRAQIFHGQQTCSPLLFKDKNTLVCKATEEANAAGSESPPPPPPSETEEKVVPVEKKPSKEEKLQLRLEQQVRMKLAKKLRLKRKRLVRKRHLRKKGRWPPSKMKKNQNV